MFHVNPILIGLLSARALDLHFVSADSSVRVGPLKFVWRARRTPYDFCELRGLLGASLIPNSFMIFVS